MTKNVKMLIEELKYSDTYSSPPQKHGFYNWFLRDNWLYFIVSFARIVLRTRREAREKRYGYPEWIYSSQEILRLLEKIGGHFEIEGIHNIYRTGDPVVFVSNHMSTLETMIFPGLIAPHRKVTFVVKESLVKNYFFRDVMRSRDPIVVGRTDPRKDFETVMREGPLLLEKGISIIIFPQSTRSEHFIPSEFNSLGVKLARKAGVNVVPVAIKTDFWGNGKIIKEFGKIDHRKIIHMKFGEPFSVKGSGKEENQSIIKFIQNHLQKWSEETLKLHEHN